MNAVHDHKHHVSDVDLRDGALRRLRADPRHHELHFDFGLSGL